MERCGNPLMGWNGEVPIPGSCFSQLPSPHKALMQASTVLLQGSVAVPSTLHYTCTQVYPGTCSSYEPVSAPNPV